MILSEEFVKFLPVQPDFSLWSLEHVHEPAVLSSVCVCVWGGYWQTPLDEESIPKTAFLIKHGFLSTYAFAMSCHIVSELHHCRRSVVPLDAV